MDKEELNMIDLGNKLGAILNGNNVVISIGAILNVLGAILYHDDIEAKFINEVYNEISEMFKIILQQKRGVTKDEIH